MLLLRKSRVVLLPGVSVQMAVQMPRLMALMRRQMVLRISLRMRVPGYGPIQVLREGFRRCCREPR